MKDIKQEAREELRHIAGSLDLAKLEFSIKAFVAERLLNEYIDKATDQERERVEELLERERDGEAKRWRDCAHKIAEIEKSIGHHETYDLLKAYIGTMEEIYE